MAMIVKKDTPLTTTTAVWYHTCGEAVTVVMTRSQVVGYQDENLHDIVVCPHCLKDLEFEDLQTVESLSILKK